MASRWRSRWRCLAWWFPALDGRGTPVHPVHYVQRRPKAGCSDTAACGTIITEGDTHNIRTRAPGPDSPPTGYGMCVACIAFVRRRGMSDEIARKRQFVAVQQYVL